MVVLLLLLLVLPLKAQQRDENKQEEKLKRNLRSKHQSPPTGNMPDADDDNNIQVKDDERLSRTVAITTRENCNCNHRNHHTGKVQEEARLLCASIIEARYESSSSNKEAHPNHRQLLMRRDRSIER